MCIVSFLLYQSTNFYLFILYEFENIILKSNHQMSQQQQISQTLIACLNHITVNAATVKLLELSKSQTFIESLLTLVFQGINDEQVLIMALTTYKNFLKEYYNHATTPITENNRKFARDTCQQLYFKIQSSSVAINVYK